MSLKHWTPPSFKPFATRHGGAIGQANERKMADAIGGGNSTRTVIRTHADGSTTMLRTRNGFPEYTTINARPPQQFSAVFVAIATMTAKFNDMYMTSGAYVFGTLGGIDVGDPLLTVEPVTYKSGTTAAVEATDLIPLYEQPPPANGEVSKLYNQTLLPGGLNSPKSEMMASVPSNFSGLMRRCVQARYGSGNTSQNMVKQGEEGSVLAGHSFARTTGIVKFPQGYFLVTLESSSGVVVGAYYPLYFPPEYADLLLTTPTQAVETLALSKAYVVPALKRSLPDISIAAGEAIAYGWNFSLTTNKAVCVVNEMLSYGYDRRIYSHLELTFSCPAAGEIACTYSLIEQVDGHIVPSYGPIWSPFGAQTIWYNRRTNNPEPTTSQNFPVYAFYVLDAVKVVRWSWGKTPGYYDVTAFTAEMEQNSWAASIFGVGAAESSAEAKYGDLKTHGFFIEGSPLTSPQNFRRVTNSINLTYVTTPGTPPDPIVGIAFVNNTQFPTRMGGAYTDYDPYVYPTGPAGLVTDPRPGNHYSVVVMTGVTGDTHGSDKVGEAAHTSSLVIPTNDCGSVYIGEKSWEWGSESKTQSIGVVDGSGRCDEWYADLVNVSGNTWKWVVQGIWWPAVRKQFAPRRTYGLIGGVTTGENITFTGGLSKITLHGPQTIVVGSVDSEIFHPNIEYSYLASPVHVISSSLYGDSRYASGALTATEVAATSGYPSDITLFVGAS